MRSVLPAGPLAPSRLGTSQPRGTGPGCASTGQPDLFGRWLNRLPDRTAEPIHRSADSVSHPAPAGQPAQHRPAMTRPNAHNGDAGSVPDGAGDTSEDGVGVGVGVGEGLALRDGCGKLIVGFGLVGVTVGVEVAGATVAGVVAGAVVEELVVADGGLTQT